MKEHLVPKFWHSNSSANSTSGSFSTDGRYLYSGKKVIGHTDTRGQKILYNYTKKGGAFISALVSRHVNLSIFYADTLVKVTDA